MKAINLNIPESLSSAARLLSESGFSCEPYRIESVGVGIMKTVTQGLTVTIEANHPKFAWNSPLPDTTPFIASIHGREAIHVTPIGFDFFSSNDKFSLASELDSEDKINEFVACFTKPFGPNGAIVGPRYIQVAPAPKQKMKP